MGNLLGEPFKDYVNKQINIRQDVHGKANRSIPELQYLNSKNAWIKLASGTSFDQSRLDLLNKNNPLLTGVVPGMDLPRKNVLFNGLSNFQPNPEVFSVERNEFNSDIITQRAGITGANRAYGVGGTSQHGYSPMPGIIDANIKDLNRGSIKKATINIKAHNRSQFDVIDALYLRLGYTVMLEWGVDKYLSDSGLQNMGTTLIDNIFFKSVDKSYSYILPLIEELREKYQGNYDGMFGVISNFSWTFEADGSYNIKLELMSQGDVIESLKGNVPKVKKDIGTVDSISPYTQITQKIAETVNVSDRTQFFELYPGLEKTITDWYNAQIGRLPFRGSDGNDISLTYLNGLSLDSSIRNLIPRNFPDLDSDSYTNENLTNQKQGQELKSFFGAILANALQEKDTITTREANTEGADYIWKIKRPNGTFYKQKNVYNFISWDYKKVLIDAVQNELDDLGYGATKPIVNGVRLLFRKRVLEVLFLVNNISLSNILSKTFAYYQFKNYAGGKEDPQFKAEGQTAEEADQREEEKEEIEQEKELIAKRNLNRVNSYLFDIRNLWKFGIGSIPGANNIVGNFGPIKSYNVKMGKIINPINGASTPIKLWNNKVGFPIYKKNEKSPVDFFQLDLTPINKQHFIRLGVLLKYIQNNIIPKIETSKTNEPMIKIDFEDKTNICYTIDNVISLNPNKIIVCSNSFYAGDKNKKVGIFEGGENFQQNTENGFIYGDLMKLYVNFSRIEEIFEDVDENNSVSIFKVLKTLATDINSSLGNINNIEPIIDKETNTVKFIDQTPIPGLKSITDKLGITFKPTTSSKLEIFGLNSKDNTSNFVRKAGITTEISKEYATIITIGATANGSIPGTESTAFSKWNIGIRDRFKENIIDAESNKKSLEEQNTAIKQRYADMITRKYFTLGMNLISLNKWTINDDLVELNSTTAPDFYKFAQAETTKNNEDDEDVESSIGFLPFNLKLEMDGISGIKIYNKLEVNTSFLPSNYGNSLSFIITGVNHKLSGNEWVTSLDTIATSATKQK